MKNKKNIYILLPTVLLVWGILVYRIFTTITPTNTKQQAIAATSDFKPQQLQQTENFTINTAYRDPFLGTLSKKKTLKSKKRVKRVAKTPKTLFPAIIYKGLVSPNGKNKQVFLISIDGQQFFFKKYATQKGIKLLRGTTKKVSLQFQGQQQTFPITK